MNNGIKVFQNEQFGKVRTLDEDGKVLFCGSDIARALGYQNASKALGDHCKGVTKRYTLRPPQGVQGVSIADTLC